MFVFIEMDTTWECPQCVEVNRNVACSLIVDLYIMRLLEVS